MTILEQIKSRLKLAMLNKNSEKDALRVLLGKIQSSPPNLNDIQLQNIVSSMIKQNLQSIEGTDKETGLSWKLDGEARLKLEQDNQIYASFLPEFWSKEKIKEFLSQNEILTKIKESSGGKAVGVAMAQLKSVKADVRGSDVKDVVTDLQGV